MITTPMPPFSARNRPETNWVEEAFPDSARTGLFLLVSDAVERYYIASWAAVARELGRLSRVVLRDYDVRSVHSVRQARFDAQVQINQLDWDRVYDFCERLYSQLAQGSTSQQNGEEASITKAQAQAFVAEELQQLFDEESLGYEFIEGAVQRRGKRHTVRQIDRADKALADQRLQSARTHFSKALRYFRDRKNPDLENAVKEAVCAVEAAAKELYPDASAATLGDFIKWATKNDNSLLLKTIAQTFTGLYGFRNSGEGVSHGAASGGAVTSELSEYVLAVAASQIILLADLAEDIEEPPF